jgi:hypothetical protein
MFRINIGSALLAAGGLQRGVDSVQVVLPSSSLKSALEQVVLRLRLISIDPAEVLSNGRRCFALLGSCN